MTQMTLAERANMEQPTISDIECGTRMAGLHVARKIALGFDMKLSELMEEAGL
jgi:transcriptional regulator with XRE-family HTH domain